MPPRVGAARITSITLVDVELARPGRLFGGAVAVLVLRIAAVSLASGAASKLPHRWEVRRTREQLHALLQSLDLPVELAAARDGGNERDVDDAFNIRTLADYLASSRQGEGEDLEAARDAGGKTPGVALAYEFCRFHPLHSLSHDVRFVAWLKKSPGGYEAYAQSRRWVLGVQATSCAVALACWLMLPPWLLAIALVACVALVLASSLAHVLYFRLQSIDATCILPSMFVLPPLGPVLLFCFAGAQRALAWQTRLVVLRGGHLELYSAANEESAPKAVSTEQLVGVILLDSSCRVRRAITSSVHLVLRTPSRRLALWAGDWLECEDVVRALREVISQCPPGFSPPREGSCAAQPLIDAQEYFAALHDGLENAKSEVFIAGWMINPDIFLLRIPRSVARRAVDVHEPCDDAFSPLSYRLETAPGKLSWVLRGWRLNNEQLVVLDQRTQVEVGDEGFAYFACANRTAAGCVRFALEVVGAGDEPDWVDVPSPNTRIHKVTLLDVDCTDAEFERVRQSRLDRVLARCVGRNVRVCVLVWKEVDLVGLVNASQVCKRRLSKLGVHVVRHAPPGRVLESLRHIGALCRRDPGLTYFSHHEKLVVMDQAVGFVGGIDLAFARFDCQAHDVCDVGGVRWPGVDFLDFYQRDLTLAMCERPFAALEWTRPHLRSPWHDVAVRVEGPIALDLARHFIGRWNAEKRRGMVVLSPLLSLGSLVRISEASLSCQVVRSVAQWSGPFSHAECSILKESIKAISEAKHFIYAENQFFSSSLADGYLVKNRVAEAIAKRIVRAMEEGDEHFRVVCLLPSTPAFEGGANNPNGRAVLFWTLGTIRALVAKIRRDAGRSPTYHQLGFYSLVQRHAANGALPALETPIYVHSKLLCVDDDMALVGSANWNDRSLLGTRDSEVGVVLRSGNFAKTLRQRLFLEHTGGLGDSFAAWDAAVLSGEGRLVPFDDSQRGGLPGCFELEGLLPVENWS